MIAAILRLLNLRRQSRDDTLDYWSDEFAYGEHPAVPIAPPAASCGPHCCRGRVPSAEHNARAGDRVHSFHSKRNS